MQSSPRHRLAVDVALSAGAVVTLADAPAHYLAHVLRVKPGDAVALFNRSDGEWHAEIRDVHKRTVTLTVALLRRPRETMIDCWVCFAPIKGGRLETIIEKATELGASLLQPVITARTIVDKVNPLRMESIAREAAEQCERTSWPEIAPIAKFTAWLADFPSDRVLIYGDETGGGAPIAELLSAQASPVGHLPEHRTISASRPSEPSVREAARSIAQHVRSAEQPKSWAILAGPEGGFTPEELALLRRMPHAHAVSLGPRILRADTAIITLAALTVSAWGDWHLRPRNLGATA